MLDTSKAFERVNYCKLFGKLIKRKVSPLVFRLLLYLYTKRKLQVRWGCCISSSLPPVMESSREQSSLSVYMDGLFEKLEKVLEVILSKDQHAFTISHLQFGFNQDMSAIRCTYVMV